MNNISFRSSLFIIAPVLLAVYLFFPQFFSWVPYLVVIVFVGVVVILFIEGKNIRKDLLTQIPGIKKRLESAIITEMNKKNSNEQSQINRLVFIEKICSEDQQLESWEQNKRYYQLLPNLLLAIGLLGTFLGITMNLIILSRNTSGAIQLEKTLADIIGSMAIAFFSSLAALVGSFFLTKLYPSYILDMEKDKLIIHLENYLDNDYLLSKNQPTLQEKMDVLIKTINNYANSINSFVTTLPQSTQSFETAVQNASNTLTKSANQINNLTTQFSQVIQNNANGINSLATQCSQVIQSNATVLTNTTQELTGLTTSFTALVTNSSGIIASLDRSKESFDRTTQALGTCTDQNLSVNTALNNNSIWIENLIQKNDDNLSIIQNNLTNISTQIEKSAANILASNQSFDTNTLQVTSSLNQYTIEVGNQNNNLQNVATKIGDSANILEQIKTQLVNLLKSLTPPSQNP